MAKQKKPAKRRAPAKPVLQFTARGLELLELIREQHAVAHADWDKNPKAGRRFTTLETTIYRAGKAILRKPVRTLSDVADRAMLSAWWAQPGDVSDPWEGDLHGFHVGAVEAVLRLAGLSFKDCNAATAGP